MIFTNSNSTNSCIHWIALKNLQISQRRVPIKNKINLTMFELRQFVLSITQELLDIFPCCSDFQKKLFHKWFIFNDRLARAKQLANGRTKNINKPYHPLFHSLKSRFLAKISHYLPRKTKLHNNRLKKH